MIAQLLINCRHTLSLASSESGGNELSKMCHNNRIVTLSLDIGRVLPDHYLKNGVVKPLYLTFSAFHIEPIKITKT